MDPGGFFRFSAFNQRSKTSEEPTLSLRINSNVQALNALRNLSQTETEMSGSISRLSTGLRITTASDDPAGLVISEGMRSQLKGIDQAIRNSQDAINMAKTVEGALEEVQRLLRDMRGLAVHSANTAVVDAAVLQANQAQIRSTIQSINRIADSTAWGQKKLLDGTAGASANVTSAANVASIYMGGTFNGHPVASGPITMTKVTQATQAQLTLGQTFASANTIVSTAGSFVINGYSFSSTGTETVQSLVAKINNMSQTTGVTASIVPSGANVAVQLTANDYGSQFGINLSDPSGILHNAATASVSGIDGVFNVTVNTSAGSQTVAFTGGRGPKESGLRLTDNYGNVIFLTQAGNAGLAAPTQVGVVTAGSVQFQIGANANQSVSYSMPKTYASNLGTSAVPGKDLSQLDITTQAGAQEAMRIIDQAITQLAQWRGDLGSFQTNFLDSTVRSLGIAQENLTASESQIRDADMALEMTEYTRLQILQQSGMAMLAQANQAPQAVLQLLKG